MITFLFTFFLLFSFFNLIYSCKYFRITSNDSEQFNSIIFERIPSNDLSLPSDTDPTYQTLITGRPFYRAIGSSSPFFLYHSYDMRSGEGFWVIHNEISPSSTSFLASVKSWAILPHLINTIKDEKSSVKWRSNTSLFNLEFSCYNLESGQDDLSLDSTLYFESNPLYQPQLAGFYVQKDIEVNNGGNSVRVETYFEKIRWIPNERPVTLYNIEENNEKKWLLGESLFVPKANAYIPCSVEGDVEVGHPSSATLIDECLLRNTWRFISNGRWIEDRQIRMLEKREYKNIYYRFFNWKNNKVKNNESLLKLTDIKINNQSISPSSPIEAIPSPTLNFLLRNNIAIPRLGLGTGGIYPEQSEEIFRQALLDGYRNFDLARAYNNEHIMGKILKEIKETGSISNVPLSREDIFIASKVWPTDLGFLPTLNALQTSLSLLTTTYLDNYFIHWPKCDSSISWMQCELIKDPEGTWQQSYNALEKAYAEGKILSIGVSNFNINHLEEIVNGGSSSFTSPATVLPHIIQNYISLTNYDEELIKYLNEKDILFQAYSINRHSYYYLEELNKIIKNEREIYHREPNFPIDSPYYTYHNLLKFITNNEKITLEFIDNNNNKKEYNINLSPSNLIYNYFLNDLNFLILPRTSSINHLNDNFLSYYYKITNEQLKIFQWDNKINMNGNSNYIKYNKYIYNNNNNQHHNEL